MKTLTRQNIEAGPHRPIKVIQFGEGNFLRAFVDYAFHLLNTEENFNAGVAVVQPIEKGMADVLNEQDGLYTLFTQGVSNGEEINEQHLVTSIEQAVNPYTDFENFRSLAREEQLEFILSNTTEAGIAFNEKDRLEDAPPSSFPAKLTTLLFERYTHFKGAQEKGLTIIPCELINYNADTLKSIVLQYIDHWKLEKNFKNWVIDSISFHNTLVDRIVPGFPKDSLESYASRLSYEDRLIVTSEGFFLWVIEGDEKLKQKLPFHHTSLNVKVVKDMQPYRTRKVRILNGAHTAMVPMAILYGNKTVSETVEKEFTGAFVKQAIFDEIIPTLELDQSELAQFARDVLDRFRNPFIHHQLASIALNSFAKFKVRVLPSLLSYVSEKQELPFHLVFSFACLIRFYKGEWKQEVLPVQDDEAIVAALKSLWEQGDVKKVVEEVLVNQKYWDKDLNEVEGLSEALCFAISSIEELGIEDGFQRFKNRYQQVHA